jgi:transcriptional regulator with XRE-family HTH domain
MSNRTLTEPAFAVDAYYREVGKNIAKARGAVGMTQAELAQAMKLNRVSVAKIETGTQRHLSHSLTQFALVLGIKTDALLPIEYRSDSKVKVRAKPESPVTKELSEVNSLLDSAHAKLKRIARKKNATTARA